MSTVEISELSLGESDVKIHEYTPLVHETEIRLLKIELDPNEDGQRWRLSIVHIEINGAPPYETVSYVWGTGARDRHLFLSTMTVLLVNENLERAIPQVCEHSSTGFLWIDQICIDQKNLAERSQQVKIMGQIYESATRVLVWLGLVDLPPCDALEWVCRVADANLASGSRDIDFIKPLQIILLGDVAAEKGQLHLDELDADLAIFQLYKGLCAEWFGRGWVFQEVVLSRECTMILASASVSLAGLFWLCQAVDHIKRRDLLQVELPDFSARLFETYTMTRMMLRTWADFHRPGGGFELDGHHFERLLSQVTPYMKTTDPRDRVYAFLGLNQDRSIRIEPNYRDNDTDIFVSATADIIRGRQMLDIFEFVCRDGEEEAGRPLIGRLPSWVPDFSRKDSLRPFQTTRCTLSGNENGRVYPHVGSCAPPLLIAHGKIVDRVMDRVELRIIQDETNPDFDFGRYLTSAKQKWTLSSRRSPAPTALSVLEAFLAQGHCEDKSLRPLAEHLKEERALGVLESVAWKSGHIEGTEAALRALESDGLGADLRDVVRDINVVSHMRYLLVTEHGRLALGCSVEAGDEICILHGCSNPVVLRPLSDERHYVRETCFLEGYMDPWSNGMIDWKEEEATEFQLV